MTPTPTRDSLPLRVLYGVAVLLVLALFLASVRPVLSPLVLFLAVLMLLTPFAGSRLQLNLILVTALLTALWLLETTGGLLAPFILALVLAYVLDPLVDRLEGLRVPRGLAILLLGLPVAAGVTLGLVFGVPALAEQVGALVERTPDALHRLIAWAERTRGRVLGWDIPLIREEVLLEPLRNLDPDRVTAYVQERGAAVFERVLQGVLGVGRGIGAALSILGYVVLTPILTYYLLRDYDVIRARLRDMIPTARRERWTAFLSEYDRLLSLYLRGQMLAAVTVGVLTGVLLWILGFPYPALVGVVAGVFNVVPYLGLIVSLIPALIIALLSGAILASLLKLAAVFVVVQLLDSSVLGPRIVGGSVGLHPVLVILALALGGSFFGFVGLLLAVPATVLIKLLLRDGIVRYRSSTLYRAPSAATD